MSNIEHIYYFNSKILDYLLEARRRDGGFRMRGTFLSTAEVGHGTMEYALAYGLTVIDPVSPPPQFMLTKTKNPGLKRAIQELIQTIAEPSLILYQEYKRGKSPSDLCAEYRFLVRRWKIEQET